MWGGNWRGSGYRSPNPSSGPASWPLPPLGREGRAQRLLGRTPTIQPKGRMSQQRIPKSISGTRGKSRLAPTQGPEYQPCLSHPPTLPRHSLPASTLPFLFNCPGPQLRLFSLPSSSLPPPTPNSSQALKRTRGSPYSFPARPTPSLSPTPSANPQRCLQVPGGLQE